MPISPSEIISSMPPTTAARALGAGYEINLNEKSNDVILSLWKLRPIESFKLSFPNNVVTDFGDVAIFREQLASEVIKRKLV